MAPMSRGTTSMNITYGDSACEYGNGVVEVYDAVAYLKYVRRSQPDKPDTVKECGDCGRMWDDAVVSAWTPAPAGRCPFDYDHEEADDDVDAPNVLAHTIAEALEAAGLVLGEDERAIIRRVLGAKS